MTPRAHTDTLGVSTHHAPRLSAASSTHAPGMGLVGHLFSAFNTKEDCHAPIMKEGGPGNSGSYTRSGGSQRSNYSSVYVLKTPKAGGSTFVVELLRWSCMYPTVVQQFRWSETGLEQRPPADGMSGMGVILREPVAHTISMYNHCQFGQGHSLHHYPSIHLDDWMRKWLEKPPTATTYCNYHPLDFQTSNLAGALEDVVPSTYILKQVRMSESTAQSLSRAIRAVRTASFVGVTHRMKESLCVAAYAIYGSLPLDGRCACASNGKGTSASSHVRHNSHGVDHSKVDLHNVSAGTLELMRKATRADQVLYAHALQRLYTDVKALEGKLGVRIMCDL